MSAAVVPEDGRGKSLDANRYATKKTIAQGMLDIALLTANASQLKYVLQAGEKHEFYSLMVGLISTSIVLQALMGVLFLSLNLMRDCRLHQQEYRVSALAINYLTLGLSMVVTTLNLLISAFDPGLGSKLAAENTVLVGIIFLVIGGLNINHEKDQRAATILNDLSVVFIFVISVLNVVISGFGIEGSAQALAAVTAT